MRDERFERYLAELPSASLPQSEEERFRMYHAYLQGGIDSANELHDRIALMHILRGDVRCED